MFPSTKEGNCRWNDFSGIFQYFSGKRREQGRVFPDVVFLFIFPSRKGKEKKVLFHEIFQGFFRGERASTEGKDGGRGGGGAGKKRGGKRLGRKTVTIEHVKNLGSHSGINMTSFMTGTQDACSHRATQF